ncbi:MAG: MG2 domain-containing protein, partial [Planctomycetes bacterium]|nr:MG2 domain-containing protein [Planctomycetota bacterium]
MDSRIRLFPLLAAFAAAIGVPTAAGAAEDPPGSLVVLSEPLPAKALVLLGGRRGPDPARAAVTLRTASVKSFDLAVFRVGDAFAFLRTQDDLRRPSIRGPVAAALGKAASAFAGGASYPGAKAAAENPFAFEMVRWERRSVEGPSAEVPLGLSKPGLYLVEASCGDHVAHALVETGRLTLLVVRSEEEILAFCADSQTGAPVAGAAVAAAARGREVWRGTTGPDGTVRARVPYAPRLLVAAEAPSGIAADDPRLYPSAPEGLTAYLYTDRPLYRPGESLGLKGILREAVAGGYALPKAGKAEVRFLDPEGTEKGRVEADVSAAGTFEAAFTVPDGCRLGRWTAVATCGGREFEASFLVEKFQRPELKVDVQPLKGRYAVGEEARFEILGTYYFGGEARGARVEYRVFETPFERRLFPAGEFAFYTPNEKAAFERKLVKSGESRLDDRGRLEVACPTGNSERNLVLELEADVADESRRFASGSGDVRVTMADVTVDVSLGRAFCLPGETVPFRVRVEGFDGRPAAGAKVSVALRSPAGAGPSLELAAGPDGEASGALPVAGAGRMTLSVSTRDAAGRGVRAARDFWSADAAKPLGHGAKTLQLIPDKAEYAPGETARVLALVPFDGAHLLATVEAEALLGHRVQAAAADAVVLSFRVEAGFAPNVTVAAAAVRDGAVHRAEAGLVVPPRDRFLKIRIRPSKPAFGPGETGEIAVAVTDLDGKPVKAELSLAVVDEALYALRPEQNPPLEPFFYPLRRNAVRRGDSTAFLSFLEGRADPARERELAIHPDDAAALLAALVKLGEAPEKGSAAPAAALAAFQARTGLLVLALGPHARFDKEFLTARFQALTERKAAAAGAEADRLLKALALLQRLQPLAPAAEDSSKAGKPEGKRAGRRRNGDDGPGGAEDEGGSGRDGAMPEAEEPRAGSPAPRPAAAPPAAFAGEPAKKDAKGEDAEPPAERKDFASSVLWLPQLATGDDGTAVAKVSFKDDLTTWRVRALAVS